MSINKNVKMGIMMLLAFLALFMGTSMNNNKANASTRWHHGTPKILRGTWKDSTNYHNNGYLVKEFDSFNKNGYKENAKFFKNGRHIKNENMKYQKSSYRKTKKNHYTLNVISKGYYVYNKKTTHSHFYYYFHVINHKHITKSVVYSQAHDGHKTTFTTVNLYKE